eukprot:TRINITY_DN5713_c0_g1_i1.p1 TRINITY_DN5713_c0_g1~~TRINITY_DN5713_c0_g1_i1.p1  ORF type:complete len:590 (+),score=89.18 TRINITY_DN5713_c0_g1_i1:37-1806(+)
MSFQRISALLFVIVLICEGQNVFTADIQVSNRSSIFGIQRVELTGVLYYDYYSQLTQITYPFSTIEYFNYTSNYRYIMSLTSGIGGTCDALPSGQLMPIYFSEPNDIVTGVTSNNCQERIKNYTRGIEGVVNKIYVNPNGIICRAIWFDGTTYDFTNVVSAAGGTLIKSVPIACSSKFSVCANRLDIELVVSESSILNATQFNNIKTFISSLSSSFAFGVGGVSMGLTLFGSNARTVIPSTTSLIDFSYLLRTNVTQLGGTNCIACGIETGLKDLGSRGRTGYQNIILFINADGESSEDDFRSIVDAAKSNRTIFFTISLLNASTSDMMEIGSMVPGTDTMYSLASVSDLLYLPQILVPAMCLNARCALFCDGYCGNGQTCICPGAVDRCAVCMGNGTSCGCNEYWPNATCDDSNSPYLDGDVYIDDLQHVGSGIVEIEDDLIMTSDAILDFVISIYPNRSDLTSGRIDVGGTLIMNGTVILNISPYIPDGRWNRISLFQFSSWSGTFNLISTRSCVTVTPMLTSTGYLVTLDVTCYTAPTQSRPTFSIPRSEMTSTTSMPNDDLSDAMHLMSSITLTTCIVYLYQNFS